MTRYAATTTVSVEKSKAEIERLLTKYGCQQFSTGTDRILLWGGFHPSLPDASGFGPDHVLLPAPAAASGGRFAMGQTGERVGPGSERTLWLKLRTPTVTTTTEGQQMQIVITAVAEQ